MSLRRSKRGYVSESEVDFSDEENEMSLEYTVVAEAKCVSVESLTRKEDLWRFKSDPECWNIPYLFLVSKHDCDLDRLRGTFDELSDNFTFMKNSEQRIHRIFQSTTLSPSQRKRALWLLDVLCEFEFDCVEGFTIINSFHDTFGKDIPPSTNIVDRFVSCLDVSHSNILSFFDHVADVELTVCGKSFFEELVYTNCEDVYNVISQMDTANACKIFGLIPNGVKCRFLEYSEQYFYMERENIDGFKYKVFEFPFLDESNIPFVFKLLIGPLPVFNDTFPDVSSYVAKLLIHIKDIGLLVNELINLDWRKKFGDASVAYLVEERIKKSHTPESILLLLKTFSESQHIDMRKVFANLKISQ